MQHNYSLKRHNTFGLDVNAAQFAACASVDAMKSALKEAEYEPWILGGGSNILLVDDIERCVIKNEIKGIDIVRESAHDVIFEIGGGEVWQDLVTWCVERNFGGLENLALIPGSVGAAPMQNIGAYGAEIKDFFVSLQALRLSDMHVMEFNKEACLFGYRDSVFKHGLKDEVCILSIQLRLSKPPHQLNTEYGAIRDTLEIAGIKNPTIADIYHAVINIRRSKLPDPAEIGNAGSFFKNPVVNVNKYEALQKEYPSMPAFATEDHQYKIPAGWLIEQCGWKGKRVGNVGCYEKQALVIVNYGGASGREVYDHAMRVKESVQERFGIELATEVNIIK